MKRDSARTGSCSRCVKVNFILINQVLMHSSLALSLYSGKSFENACEITSGAINEDRKTVLFQYGYAECAIPAGNFPACTAVLSLIILTYTAAAGLLPFA